MGIVWANHLGDCLQIGTVRLNDESVGLGPGPECTASCSSGPILVGHDFYFILFFRQNLLLQQIQESFCKLES